MLAFPQKDPSVKPVTKLDIDSEFCTHLGWRFVTGTVGIVKKTKQTFGHIEKYRLSPIKDTGCTSIITSSHVLCPRISQSEASHYVINDSNRI